MFKVIGQNSSIEEIKEKLGLTEEAREKKPAIFCDSRQQRNSFNRNIHKGFERQGFKAITTKLYVGDYDRKDSMNVVVDTKRGPGEIVRNLCSDDRERFKREALRAKEHGIRLIVLIVDDKITSINDVKSWVNPRGQIQGPQLAKTMSTWVDRYVHLEFC